MEGIIKTYRKLADIFVPHEGEEKGEKRRFYPIILIFVLVWFSMVYTTSNMEVKIEEETIEIEKLPERFAKIVVPRLVEEKEKIKEVGKKKEGKKEEEKKEEGKKEEEKKEIEEKKEEEMTVERRKEIIKERVREVGVLALLTAKGEGGSPIAEMLGGSVVQNLDELLGAVGGVRVAEVGEDLKPLELAGGKLRRRTEDIGELAAGRGGREVELGEKKVAKVQSKISMESADIESGEIDEAVIRRILIENQASIRYCFQKAQMKNPELQGKIVVRVTVDADGNVSNIEVDESTIEDQEMVSCVLRMVRRWKFPATGGEVIFSLPLVFISMT